MAKNPTTTKKTEENPFMSMSYGTILKKINDGNDLLDRVLTRKNEMAYEGYEGTENYKKVCKTLREVRKLLKQMEEARQAVLKRDTDIMNKIVRGY